MDDKLKVFWNLDVLVKMCRSKNDGPSLRIEEVEIIEKIKAHKQEIEEIKLQIEEESYDTSAEMADRNIEIITKKQLQTLKSELKEKNKNLTILKEQEEEIYSNNTLLKETKNSQQKYIISMQERVSEATNYEVIDRYNALIAETTEKAAMLSDDIEIETEKYNTIQENIINTTDEISVLEEKIDKKKKLLEETQANLENKDNYIDKTKREKNNKKISELESKIDKLNKRLEEIRKDPKYLESRIKDVINNNEQPEEAKGYLLELINIVIKQPYINVPADNSLEEELLKATQARDSFANEIDQKSYNILEADTPEKVRIEFLTERIKKWQSELNELKVKVEQVDKDQEFDYESKNQQLYNMINTMKIDLKEFQRAFDETPETSISYKASLRAQIDEKKEDIVQAEKIATAFRKDESEDIAKATRTMKYECEQISQNITNAEVEISEIKNRLTTKKSGLIDITSKNKDKDTLKELAQTVIDIKHRRQFAETPIEIIQRLDELLGLNLMMEIDNNTIANNSSIVTKNYDVFTTKRPEMPVEVKVDTDITNTETAPKRGIKVINEATISNPLEGMNNEPEEEEVYDEIQNPLGLENESEEPEVLNSNPEQPVETIEIEKTLDTISETNEENKKEEVIEQPEEKDLEETPKEIEQNSLEESDKVEQEIKETTDIEKHVALIEDIPQKDESKNVEESNEQPEETEKKKETLTEEAQPTDSSESTDEEDEETPLDIAALIEEQPEEPKKESDFSINNMFNNTKEEKNDNMVTSEDLEDELDKFINELGINNAN